MTQTAIYAALLAAKKAMGPLTKDAQNPHFRNRYASLEAVIDTIEGPLHDNGLLVLQRLDVVGGQPVLVTEIVHAETGDRVSSTAPLVCKDPENPQALGGALTYMRRYSLVALLGLAAEDDDGNAAAQPRPSPRDNAQTTRPNPPQTATTATNYPPGPEPTSIRAVRPASDEQMNYLKGLGKARGAVDGFGHTDIPAVCDLLFSEFDIRWDGVTPLSYDDAKRVLDEWAPIKTWSVFWTRVRTFGYENKADLQRRTRIDITHLDPQAALDAVIDHEKGKATA
jgi:hypothetical protein